MRGGGTRAGQRPVGEQQAWAQPTPLDHSKLRHPWGKGAMTRSLAPETRPMVAEYLMASMPEFEDGVWDDQASSAWQFAGMALEALGYASEGEHNRAWHRLDPPQMPAALPRWDDSAVVVLSVLAQRGEIEYRQRDGARYEPPAPKGFVTWRPSNPPPAPLPNIAAAQGSGPAYARPERIPLLEGLGLVKDGAWTQDAELLLWREQPQAWKKDLPQDPRFETGLKLCLRTMPAGVAETMRDLAQITAQDVDAAVVRQERANAELVEKYPAQAKFDRRVTREGKFRSLVFIARCQMDDLFYAGWRLQDGWLSGAQKAQALPLFHDPLAHDMRAAAFTAMGLEFPEVVPA